MNSRNFDDLKQLVGVFTSGEIATAKKFLVAFDSNVTKGKNKNQALLKLILNRPAVTIAVAKKKISPEVDDRSFDRLVLRLREKLVESLLVEINTSKKEVYNKWLMTRFDIRKRYMQATILMGRGMYDEAMRMAEKIIDRAKEFELYNELVECLTWYQQEKGLRLGQQFFENYDQDVALYKRCRAAVERSFDYYYRYFITEVDAKGLSSDKVGLLTEAISDLQAEFEYTQSANVGRFLYTLLGTYYISMEDYAASVATSMQLIELTKSSPAIYSPNRIGMAYSDLADTELFRHNFSNAREFAVLAQEWLENPVGYNRQMAREIEFKALYYSGDLDGASAVIDSLCEDSQMNQAPFQLDKRTYLKACVLYMQGNHRESFLLLNDCAEIENDKEGWNIGIRVLSIMNMVEVGKLDNADAKIEALRKHLSRYADVVRERDAIILKILVQLVHSSFDFDLVFKSHAPLLRTISQNETGLRWEVKTPELVVFQDWFMAKKSGLPYSFKLPDSALAAMENPRKAKPILAKRTNVPV